jgi:hypothetical protein
VSSVGQSDRGLACSLYNCRWSITGHWCYPPIPRVLIGFGFNLSGVRDEYVTYYFVTIARHVYSTLEALPSLCIDWPTVCIWGGTLVITGERSQSVCDCRYDDLGEKYR